MSVIARREWGVKPQTRILSEFHGDYRLAPAGAPARAAACARGRVARGCRAARDPASHRHQGEKRGRRRAAAARALELARRALKEEISSRDALSSPRAVRDYLRLALAGREQEVFVVLLLDAQHRVIACEELFHGTLTQTSVYPREVVKCSLKHNAAAVIFAHNHPSGVAEPCHADELLTRSLKSALALVDIQVLDHFIVAGTRTMSFAERGLL